MSKPSPEEQIRFLSNIQRLLDEGSFTSTYKFGLLTALADLSVEKGDDSGNSLKLTTRDMAEKFILYYWRQARPYAAMEIGRDTSVLRQNTGKRAKVISLVREAAGSGYGRLTSVGLKGRERESLIRQVARTVEIMPLWKLQVIGGGVAPFLYENTGRGHEVVLKEGIAYCFRHFHGLVRNIVQGAWVRFVRNLRGNQRILGEGQDLAEFLFGGARSSLDEYRSILREIQSGRCFYCGKTIGGSAEVDHFVPWSRYPLDLGHNFVLAHRACNSDKRDFLAAPPHLECWLRRNDDHGSALSAYFDGRFLSHNIESSKLITCWAYSHAEEAGADVWYRVGEVAPLGPVWRSLLGA